MSKIKQYDEWYDKQYGMLIKLSELKKKSANTDTKWLAKAIDDFYYNYSSLRLFSNYISLKYFAIPKKTEYIVSVFKLSRQTSYKDLQTQYHTIYAFLYSSLENKKIKHEYVCISPTFKSADGEYRRRFIRFDQYQYQFNKHTANIEIIEEHILKQLKSGIITITTDTFVPDENTKILSKIKKNIDQLRLSINFLIVMWVAECPRLVMKTYENHLQDGFHKAMFNQEDVVLYKKWSTGMDENKAESIAESFDEFTRINTAEETTTYCGQKFLPLRVKEIEDANNIKYQPWREMYVTSLVADLVVNGISPSVPLLAHWFLMQVNDKRIYDNAISHIKLDHSFVADSIVKEIEHARSHTYNYDKDEKDEIFISYRMEGLSDAIEIPMSFAEKEIIMSNETLCFIMQHVGRTFADIHNLMSWKWYRVQTGPIFSDYFVFSKYLFEYVWTLYALNSKLDVIHGDLHLNNCTIYLHTTFSHVNINELPIPNPHVIYDLSHSEQTDNLKDVFIFPHFGRQGCIIDFSRALIGRKRIEKDFPEEYATRYILSQRKRMAKLYKKELPEFAKENSDRIDIAMIENFDVFFKIFTAMDSYKLTKGIKMLFQSKGIATNENIIPLLDKANGIAFQFLTTQMKRLFDRQISTVDDVEYPNHVILKECFKHCLIENYELPKKEGNVDISLVDVFCIRNEMKYNTRNYDEFNPLMTYDYVLKHKVPIGLDQLGYKNLQDMKKYYKQKSEKDRLEEIEKEVLDKKAERRGTPYVQEGYKLDKKVTEMDALESSDKDEIESHKTSIDDFE